MSWQDRRRPASFRGVPFHVLARTRDGGRRGPTHEFPQRDLPDAEDTGRKLRTFRVDGLVLGDDYDLDLVPLLDALEAPGPGTYVDPWQKEWRVVVRTFTCREGDDTGGLARLTISFEESGEERFPSAAIDTPGAVGTAADALITAAKDIFSSTFDLTARPQFLADDALSFATRLADTVETLRTDLVQLPLGLGGGVMDAARAVETFKSTVDVRDDFASSVETLFADVAKSAYQTRLPEPEAGRPQSASAVFAKLFVFDAKLAFIPDTTATRRQQATNRAAQVRLVQRLAVAEECRSLASVSFDSFDTAMAVRDDTVTRLDALLDATGNAFEDIAFATARDARAALVQDIAARAGPLPRIRRIPTEGSLPAVVHAHKLYADAARADELLARNPTANHPGFIVAGGILEALSR